MNPTRNDIEQRLRQNGYEVTEVVDSPGTIREQAVHDHDEMLVLIEGSVEIDMGGLTRIPEIGEEIFLPALTVHTLRNVGDTNAVWLVGRGRP